VGGHILAMGGGGFSMEPENPLLDRYLLSLSPKKIPKVCFIGTASGDSESYIKRFYDAFASHPCQPSHLALFRPPAGDLREFVLDKDIFYVGGGNTRNLLVLWKEWKLDLYLKEAWQNGTILAGISAGSICWFEQGLTDSVTGKLLPLQCLGFVKGSNCPHYDGEAERRPAYQREVQAGAMMPGLACDDGVAAHFVDGKFLKCVSSRPNAAAYQLEVGRDGFVERKIAVEFLG
jgi:dipeptidase E